MNRQTYRTNFSYRIASLLSQINETYKIFKICFICYQQQKLNLKETIIFVSYKGPFFRPVLR